MSLFKKQKSKNKCEKEKKNQVIGVEKLMGEGREDKLAD